MKGLGWAFIVLGIVGGWVAFGVVARADDPSVWAYIEAFAIPAFALWWGSVELRKARKAQGAGRSEAE